MLIVKSTKRFRKDVKRMKKRQKNLDELFVVTDLLLEEKPLPFRYFDHPLKGDFSDSRECHIQPDWLLIYTILGNELILERTGTHSDVFRK